MNQDTTSECPIKPECGCRRTSIEVQHTSMEVRTSKEVCTLSCSRPTPGNRGQRLWGLYIKQHSPLFMLEVLEVEKISEIV